MPQSSKIRRAPDAPSATNWPVGRLSLNAITSPSSVNTSTRRRARSVSLTTAWTLAPRNATVTRSSACGNRLIDMFTQASARRSASGFGGVSVSAARPRGPTLQPVLLGAAWLSQEVASCFRVDERVHRLERGTGSGINRDTRQDLHRPPFLLGHGSARPNGKCKPRAAPSSSARSVAIAVTSARSHSATVSGRGNPASGGRDRSAADPAEYKVWAAAG